MRNFSLFFFCSVLFASFLSTPLFAIISPSRDELARRIVPKKVGTEDVIVSLGAISEPALQKRKTALLFVPVGRKFHPGALSARIVLTRDSPSSYSGIIIKT